MGWPTRSVTRIPAAVDVADRNERYTNRRNANEVNTCLLCVSNGLKVMNNILRLLNGGE
jgi:hypothetical protein